MRPIRVPEHGNCMRRGSVASSRTTSTCAAQLPTWFSPTRGLENQRTAEGNPAYSGGLWRKHPNGSHSFVAKVTVTQQRYIDDRNKHLVNKAYPKPCKEHKSGAHGFATSLHVGINEHPRTTCGTTTLSEMSFKATGEPIQCARPAWSKHKLSTVTSFISNPKVML